MSHQTFQSKFIFTDNGKRITITKNDIENALAGTVWSVRGVERTHPTVAVKDVCRSYENTNFRADNNVQVAIDLHNVRQSVMDHTNANTLYTRIPEVSVLIYFYDNL